MDYCLRNFLVYTRYVVFLVALGTLWQVEGRTHEFIFEYGDRGDRWEGIQVRKMAGESLELLAAMWEPQKTITANTGKQIKLRFFLPEKAPVFIIVREILRHNYWMQPKRQEWVPGWNMFSWTTKAVLEKLHPQPQLSQLMSTVRIGGSYAKKIAPALLYCDVPPPSFTGYRFVFRANGNAELVCKWYKLSADEPILLHFYQPPLQPAGKTFIIKWDGKLNGGTAPKGWYQLTVTGTIERLGNREPIGHEYKFYHQPNLENIQ